MHLLALACFCIFVAYSVYKYRTKPLTKSEEEVSKVKEEQVLASNQVKLSKEKDKLSTIKSKLEE